MALPAGISTVVITTGTPTGFDGEEDIKTQVTVTPSLPLTWAATGTPVLDFVITRTAEAGMPASFVVPHVDQPGFIDASGNAFTMWAYKVEITWTDNSSRAVKKAVKNIQPLVGQQGPIDIDLIPYGSIQVGVSAPVPEVLSVAGLTGNVTVPQLQAAGLGGGGGGASTWDAITGKPATFPPTAHDHDDRYYTEAEVDALLAGVSGGGEPLTVGLTAPTSGWWIEASPPPISATGPTWTDDTTNGGGTWTTPTEMGVIYSPASGAAQPDETVTVTATADTGYTLTGTTSWQHAFPADTVAPQWSATFTLGAPTTASVVATASAMPTDNWAVTGYQVAYDGGTTPQAITPSGSGFTLAGTAGTTYSTTVLRAVDAGGLTSAWLAVPEYTLDSSADITAPASGTLTETSKTHDSAVVTVTGASDETALHAQPYRLTVDAGTPTAWQASNIFNLSNLTPETAYSVQHETRDAAGNTALGAAITVTTDVAPGGGGALFTDDFNRIDNPSLGADWVKVSAGSYSIGISNNAAIGMALATGHDRTVAGTTTSDNYAQADVVTVGGNSMGIMARVSTDGSGYLWRYNGTNCQLIRLVGTTTTTIGSAYAATLTVPFTLRVEAVGTTITGYVNGVQRAQVTDSAVTTGTHAAMRLAGEVVRLDNFEMGQL